MEITRSLCLQALAWCKQKYGPSKHQKEFPRLVFHRSKKPRVEDLLGEYFWEKNHIVIYRVSHLGYDDPVLTLISTLIHEYKHFLQDMTKYNMYFDKYRHRYESHPYEKTCNKFADREMYECYYYVTKKKKYRKKG